ncbi:YeiH family protein [Sphingomonas xanthus]|uniref:Putative sulfate exporter family transporter n=1 Tax=Sphingomonas xanthus TaxID=2594473 RepID=A0A516IPG7_9SPHN|nr:putative sulfate exporter family transporter [Sphingomonas xanthus]QDP18822.1 putative sulfate exporter family transporter [Sphingomonas xanthus]
MVSIRAPLPLGPKAIAPGLAAALLVAAAASFLSDHYGGPVMLFALLFGMAMNFIGDIERCRAGIAFASRNLLRLGVALLGFRITLGEVGALGWRPVLLVILIVSLTILISAWLARRIGYGRDFGLLTGGATAICGASAAMAISAALPSHPDRQKQMLFAVIGVSTLSTVAMITYPLLAALLGFDDRQAGIFVGAAIHDVAQVVGAGYAISSEAGDVATVVKLMRVAMLLPVILLIGVAVRRQVASREGRPPLLPWFAVAFALLVVGNSLLPLPPLVSDAGSLASRWFLVTAIAALGMNTRLADIAEFGWKPVMLMIAETTLIAVLALVPIAFGWV